MGPLVCMGTGLMCSFGAAPSSIVPSPSNVTTDMMPAATIADCVPIVNIPPFGMCIAPTNPAFIAATAAAMGVPVPVPCVPVPAGPWAPGCPTILIDGVPALDVASTLMCSWLGVITIVAPAQTQVVAVE